MSNQAIDDARSWVKSSKGTDAEARLTMLNHLAVIEKEFGRIEQEIDRLNKHGQLIGPTIGENAILKSQVNTLIFTLERIVMQDFTHVDSEENR